ncbi:hypothetical protein [Poseidonia sp.]|uniref:hypothetical protein n=1 Tax=Poseidonia sp. TaxID=2666344 RepID=UPI003F699568
MKKPANMSFNMFGAVFRKAWKNLGNVRPHQGQPSHVSVMTNGGCEQPQKICSSRYGCVKKALKQRATPFEDRNNHNLNSNRL